MDLFVGMMISEGEDMARRTPLAKVSSQVVPQRKSQSLSVRRQHPVDQEHRGTQGVAASIVVQPTVFPQQLLCMSRYVISKRHMADRSCAVLEVTVRMQRVEDVR